MLALIFLSLFQLSLFFITSSVAFLPLALYTIASSTPERGVKAALVNLIIALLSIYMFYLILKIYIISYSPNAYIALVSCIASMLLFREYAGKENRNEITPFMVLALASLAMIIMPALILDMIASFAIATLVFFSSVKSFIESMKSIL